MFVYFFPNQFFSAETLSGVILIKWEVLVLFVFFNWFLGLLICLYLLSGYFGFHRGN